MIKKSILFLVLIMVSAGISFSAEKVRLPELVNPGRIEVHGNDIYIVERATISIYSLNGFKLVKKFGKEGEGPQEFKLYPYPGFTVRLKVFPDSLAVISIGKLSWFSRQGKFIKEYPTMAVFDPMPVEKNYAGFRFVDEDNTNFRVLNLYDSEFKKIKELHRRAYALQEGRSFVPIGRIVSTTTPDKIYVAGNEGFTVKVFDSKGNLLHTIKRDVEKHKLTSADKKDCLGWFKNHDPSWPVIKDLIRLPEYYPAIREIFVDGKRICVQSHIMKDGTSEFYIFDSEGAFIKKVFLPLVKNNWLRFYPYTIRNGSLYHLIDNEDEEWELHVTPIKQR